MLKKGSLLASVVSLVAAAGVLASLGASWIDGP
jgi:hypothetical protein